MRALTPGPKAVIALCVLVAMSAFLAAAAGNTVPPSKASDTTRAISPNDLKPNECNAITVTVKIAGSGTITGGAASELIVGSASADTISGGGGDDCIVGGAGDDTLGGDDGTDVIVGGDGNDAVDGGTGTDTCYGGAGTDTFANCETQFQ